MQAETLKCPMCGASAESDASQCQYCSARLATVACPSCFGLMFIGSTYCSHCGSRFGQTALADLPPRKCPRCRVEMKGIMVGKAMLRECTECEGLWADVKSFDEICADREQQAAVLGSALPAVKTADAPANVRYVPCPECSQLMNRINFAHYSGVIIDLCKAHGTWFDRDELRRVVEFIRAGGLDAARAREKRQLEEERRALQHDHIAANGNLFAMNMEEEDDQSSLLAVAKEIFKLF